MNNAIYRRVTACLIAVWFVFALSASALHVFKTDLLAVALGLAVTIPIVAFLSCLRHPRRFGSSHCH